MPQPTPEPTTVWKVELARGRTAEREGSLTLEADALVFAPAGEAGRREPISLDAVATAKRLRGSPVMVVTHREGPTTARTAFYFVQPPALRVPDDATEVRRPFQRTTRRTIRRRGVSTLAGANRFLREDVRAWERAVRDALAERRAGGGAVS